MFYSPSTKGFYDEAIHGVRKLLILDQNWSGEEGAEERNTLIDNPDCLIPVDAVNISDEEYLALLSGQAAGKVIVPGLDGAPVLADRAPPTPEQKAAAALADVDALLGEATKKIAPLQDAVDLEIATPDEKAALAAWKRYRVLLSRIAQQPGYPDVIEWPARPAAS
ncbi:tail fiber assembly protein [Herbaspirillum camelliae]|uniref:tail fiber assembly protein n=1 Tax=Herbaspirillum camelliae TaxID=1892903 RepID=UPI000949DBF4|nr:tail fiber assembly protein [Herbaspirillum camelliae]